MTITISTARLHLACAALAMLALHSCSPDPAYAATPLQLRWTAELSDPKPYNAVLFQGESADLVATLKLYGRAVALEDTATASLYWQTNGMGSAWWQSAATVTTAGVVTASWTPDMDAGADLYRWHIGVANAASSTIYRAFGAFRMQPAPGAVPNEIELPARAIDFAAVTVLNPPWATPADVASATGAVSVAASGGYASDLFWYPTSTAYPDYSASTNTFALDDIVVVLADPETRINRRLSVVVDERPTIYEIHPPEGAWSVASGYETIATLSNDVLVAQGAVGVVRAVFTTDDGEAKEVAAPFTRPIANSVVAKPAVDVAGSWREAVSTNVIAMFSAVDTNAVSTYRFHRETTFGTNGVSTWTFPNSLQLYETNGVNTDAHDPRTVNDSFAWPAVADALRCVSSWRGDWYAHRPFIAVAPHYGISVTHWRQSNTWVPWCVDRAADTWMTNRLASTGHEDPGRVGAYGDVSVHRFTEAFPTNILMRFCRQTVLASASASMLNGAIGMTASSHNTVHLAQLQPPGAPPATGHKPWDAYEVVWDHARWLPRDYAGVEALVHNTHLWDSGHLSFFWLPNGVMVPVGTFTWATGGGNALMRDTLIERVAEIVEADSMGSETLIMITAEELQ